MKIKNQTILKISTVDDLSLTYETLIMNYAKSIMTITDEIGMGLSIATILSKDSIDESTNHLFNMFAPTLYLCLTDEDEIITEFYFEKYSESSYQAFKEWIALEAIFYIQSKYLTVKAINRPMKVIRLDKRGLHKTR